MQDVVNRFPEGFGGIDRTGCYESKGFHGIRIPKYRTATSGESFEEYLNKALAERTDNEISQHNQR